MWRVVVVFAVVVGACGGAPKKKAEAPPAPEVDPDVELTEQEILIRRKVHFEVGSAEIFPNSFSLLTRVAELMVERTELQLVEVQGHTDSTGSEVINRRLSKERAAAVRQYLIDKGVDAQRLTAKGYGSSVPIADNETIAGREQNRRVQFKILQRSQ